MAAGASGGVRAGRAYVELSADSSKLHAALRTAQTKVLSFGQSIRGIAPGVLAVGASVVAPIAAIARSFAQAGSEIADASARTGLSAEALSELGYAAKQTGADLGAVETATRIMARTLGEAQSGSRSAADGIRGIGLSVQQLAALKPDERFAAVAAAIARIPDVGARAAAAMQIFGKSGTQLLPMAADMGTLRQEARRLGVTMTTEQAQAADALGDAYDALGASVKGVSNAIGAELAPALTENLRVLSESIGGVHRWAKENSLAIEMVKAAADKLWQSSTFGQAAFFLKTYGKLSGAGGAPAAARPAGGAQIDAENAAETAKLSIDAAKRAQETRLKLIADENDRAVAMIESRYDEELAKAREVGARKETIGNLEQARLNELAKLTQDQARDRAKAEAQFAFDVRTERIAVIRDEYAQAIAAIEARHALEVRLAQIVGDVQKRFDADRLRIAQLITAQLQEQAREAARAADVAARNKRRGEDIEELRLRTMFKGLTLEKALLELQRQRAVAAARVNGENVAAINEEFALRQQLLEAGQQAARTQIRGGFEGMRAWQQFAVGGETEENKKQTKALVEIRDMIRRMLWRPGMAFG